MDIRYTLIKKFSFKRKLTPDQIYELARKIGVRPGTVYTWISGKNVPPPAMVEKIRKVELD